MTTAYLDSAGFYAAMGLAAAVLLLVGLVTVAVARALPRARTPAMPSGPVHPTPAADATDALRSGAGVSTPESRQSPTPPTDGSLLAGDVLRPARRKTILVAEDDPVTSLALSLRLKRLGFEVWCSPDALHALLGSERLHPEAVILDVAMPGGDGLAVCEMLACDPARANVLRIVHTSHADVATQTRCRELGAHHIEKSSKSWKRILAVLEEHFGPLTETSQAAEDPIERRPQGNAPGARAPVAPADAAVCGRARVTCVGSERRLGPVEQQLRDLGASPLLVQDAEDAFWTCVSDKPHLVVLDGDSSANECQDLIHRLKEHPVTRHLPIAVVGGSGKLSASQGESDGILRLPLEPTDDDLLRELRRWIPLGPDDGASPKPAKAGDAAQSTALESPEGERGTILCIDDDREIAVALSTRLAAYGIGVRTAASGSEGIQDALGRTPDLILLDMKMPDGEGNYVLSRLKSHPLLESIPVVFLTAESNPAVARQMLSLGAAGFLSKPVRWQELFTEIGRHMELPEQLVRDYHLPEERLLAAH